MNASVTYQQELKFFTESCNFLSLLLNERPTEELIVHLRESSSRIQEIMPFPDTEDRIDEGAGLMLNYLENTKTQTAGEVSQDLAVDWTRIFRGVAPGYSPPPPYEALYRGDNSQENHVKVFLDMTKEYSSLGLCAKGQCSRPDYIGVQMAYLHFLCCEELKRIQEGNLEEVQRFKERTIKFISEHVGQWVLLFSREAKGFARTDFYRGLLNYLPTFIQELKEYECSTYLN
ncbi:MULTISPECIES: molecular chaperone TorD family protein [Dehalobacter]|uniref:Uncharacterized protein n=2 Tax=Dehalobacter restrictus TaxID=55583 RepID=A0A857DG17_9FIRM|nr:MULTISPECIES: molecular chaperone TorD family protein [Dehalobacter]AHF11267.1 hypothetical protein DEHRE_03665 [Dehalobacter restrictus DSM 9455]MCG1025248.1 molecular chaperone TorD family protein [Dehalobacter sp.]MDJ0305839.1 molecular chaperone TorD family protein [Dehalobacter sp.]OCZ52289.1 hypothetical protein A7D23_10895 [Dehalobacter sp. TeCB1]QGZ99836.1 hypothetical protein GQ588_03830 [Dehalobacter restrictus]